MTKSSIPADHVIRVLTTIKNGAVICEKVLPSYMVIASMEDFIELAVEAGKIHDLAEAAKEAIHG